VRCNSRLCSECLDVGRERRIRAGRTSSSRREDPRADINLAQYEIAVPRSFGDRVCSGRACSLERFRPRLHLPGAAWVPAALDGTSVMARRRRVMFHPDVE